MALVHDRLYNSNEMSSIEFSQYINDMVSDLSKGISDTTDIRFETDIKKVQLGIDKAIPIGLMVNELITNSLKYAFPDQKSGIIRISLDYTSNKQYILTVKDTGIGMPEHVDPEHPKSVGLQLIQGLAQQINASLQFSSNEGTMVVVKWSDNENE